MKKIPIFDFTDLPQNSVSRQVTAVEQLGILCGLNRRASRRLAKTVFLILSNYPLESFVENSINFSLKDYGWALQFQFSTDSIPANDTTLTKGFASLRRAGEKLKEFAITGNLEDGIEIEFFQSLAIGFEIPKSRELKNWGRIISGGDWEEAFSQLNRIFQVSRSKIQQLRDGISIQREVLESDKGQADAILSLVASKTDNPVVILNQTGTIEWVNVAFHQITGVDAQQETKTNVAEVFFSHASNESARVSFEQSLTGQRSFVFEYFWQCETRKESDQETQVVWIEFQATPIRDENDEVVRWIAIGSNVTQRRQAELAMKAAKDLAESASKAKSEFLAMMSHEIRTPMNAILGMTELTLGSELTIEQREYLTTANNSAQSLLQILNEILDLSKVEAGRLELEHIEFNLADLVRETIDTLAVLAQKKGLTLNCDFPWEIHQYLVGDLVRIRQILVNLIGNAIKFTYSGEVLLQLELTDDINDRQTIHFKVRDSGVGIAEEKIGRIFEAFYQADASVTRQYGGTGLGLSISSELVRLMGGRIWVESKVGTGSTFHFVLTLPKSHPTVAAIDAHPSSPLRGKQALLLSRNEVAQKCIQQWLSNWQVSLHCVVSIEKSMNVDRFDVVLIDVDSLDDDAYQYSKTLIDAKGPKQILIFSAGQRISAINNCRSLGVENFLIKPVSPHSLINSMQTAIGQPFSMLDEAERIPVGSRSGPSPADFQPIELTNDPISVLVVDDHAPNRSLITEILRKRGHSSRDAADGKTALEILQQSRFDVVLMDVQMPLRDGLLTTGDIRALNGPNARVPIIAVTAYVTDEDRKRCLNATMDDYLAKPIDLWELIEKTERWGNTQRTDQQSSQPANGFGNQLLIQDVPDWATEIVQTVVVAHEQKHPANGDPNNTIAGLVSGDNANDDGSPTMDFESALARFAGDRELLKMQMGFFLQETPELLSSIEKAIVAVDCKSLLTSSHRLKGLIRTYDDELGAELATRLEEMGRDNSIIEARSILSLLTPCVARLKQNIEEYLVR